MQIHEKTGVQEELVKKTKRNSFSGERHTDICFLHRVSGWYERPAPLLTQTHSSVDMNTCLTSGLSQVREPRAFVVEVAAVRYLLTTKSSGLGSSLRSLV